MTRLTLPTPPDLSRMPADHTGAAVGDWLMQVARKCGEPALDFALGAAGWPGTPQQREMLPDSLIEMARNEARQLASETWAKEAIARGTWGV